MQKSILIGVVVCLLFGLGGCAREQGQILARVDEEVLTLTEFNERISRLPEQYQAVINKNKQRFLDDYVVELLIYKEAIRQGLDKHKDAREVLREARRKILMAKYIEEEVEKKIVVEEAELRDYYEKNRDKFLVPERMRASHILVKTEEKAKELLDKLSEGAGFEELAGTESMDLTNRRGGDVGYFTKGQLVPEFEEACEKLSVGEISPAVKTSFGYHIIKLTDRKPAHSKEFEEVKEEVEKEMTSLKRRDRFSRIVEELKNKASIEIYSELLIEENKEEEESEE